MLASSIKLSVLLIASQFIHASYQQCLGTAKAGGSGYTFALAQIKDVNNPLGPQEACYYECGAQVVTQSANRGDMARLTLMDGAAGALTSTGFLKAGQSYFLNHLGLEDEEGGNGMGCIQVLPNNRVNHFPRSHPVCSEAKIAVCGFWGQQSIPAPSQTQPSLSVPPIDHGERKIPSPTPVQTTPRARRPKPTKTPRPQKPKVVDVAPEPAPAPPVSPPAPPVPEANVQQPAISNGSQHPNVLHTFNANGQRYHVIGKNNGNSLAQASQSCQTSRANIGGVTSAGYQGVAEKLQGGIPNTGDKLIIGSWNGDNYALHGNNCLILQVNHGIYPGSCTEATAILCQA